VDSGKMLNCGNFTKPTNLNTYYMYLKTRGPRGPWVAYLRKRSKVTVEPIIENPRGII